MDSKTLVDMLKGTGSSQVVDALCPTLEAFDKLEGATRRNLLEVGLHQRQVDFVVRRSRELMAEGKPYSIAFVMAANEVGKPARKKDIIWDDELRQVVSRFPGGTFPL